MSDFSKLSEQEKSLVASLPYKVGIWISYAEDQDGEGDDEREASALEKQLHRFAKMHEAKPFLSDIIQETLNRREEWAGWADNALNVLTDIKAAVTVLRQKTNADNIKDLKRALMEVGRAVAQASGEFDETAEKEGIFSRIINKFSIGKADGGGDPMNVSAAEDSALEQLRAVLQNKA